MTDTNCDIPNIDIKDENEVKKETKKVSFKSRNFLFTLNQPEKYDTLKNILDGLKSCDYYISCLEEAPTTGHKHIHMYVHFNNAYKLNQKILDLGIHIDICRGSPKQNIAYVEKNGNIIDEYGTRPRQGMSTVGDLMKINDPKELNFNEYNTWEKIHSKMNNRIKVDDLYKNIKVYYIFGPSGVGKTVKAKEILKENGYEEVNTVNYENGFWYGVEDDWKAALYDEFRDSCMKPSEFIKFIDYNRHQLNIKGGHILNNYELIIITSVQNPKYIYRNIGDEPRKQWLRRMEIIDMTPKEENNDDYEIDHHDGFNIRDEDVM